MLRLRDIMTADVLTVTPQTTLREAAELFAARHLSGAPVVDGGEVLGVVSTSDILGFEPDAPAREEEDEWDESAPWANGDEPQARFYTDLWRDPDVDASTRVTANGGPAWDPLADHVVGEVMTRRVFALRPSEDVSAAAERMRTAEVHRVLVMEDGELLGIVTTMDIARAVADHRITHRTYVFGRPAREVGRDHRLM